MIVILQNFPNLKSSKLKSFKLTLNFILFPRVKGWWSWICFNRHWLQRWPSSSCASCSRLQIPYFEVDLSSVSRNKQNYWRSANTPISKRQDSDYLLCSQFASCWISSFSSQLIFHWQQGTSQQCSPHDHFRWHWSVPFLIASKSVEQCNLVHVWDVAVVWQCAKPCHVEEPSVHLGLLRNKPGRQCIVRNRVWNRDSKHCFTFNFWECIISIRISFRRASRMAILVTAFHASLALYRNPSTSSILKLNPFILRSSCPLNCWRTNST